MAPLKNSAKFKEKILPLRSFLVSYKTTTQVFSTELREILQSIFFTEKLRSLFSAVTVACGEGQNSPS